MLQQETVLQYLDDYTFLLTGLRQKLETFGEHRKRVANLLILEQTHGLLDVFRRGYEEDPEGCVHVFLSPPCLRSIGVVGSTTAVTPNHDDT